MSADREFYPSAGVNKAAAEPLRSAVSLKGGGDWRGITFEVVRCAFAAMTVEDVEELLEWKREQAMAERRSA